ncbi:MAG: hypothetical protein IT453_08185 [Planctomycetes bacterium]|nr:hypothetical protein [Planctomycetota bacterium]
MKLSASFRSCLLVSLALLPSLASAQTKATPPLVFRVPNTTLHVAFRAADFRVDAEMLAALGESLGDSAVACGALSATGSNLSLIATRNDRGLTAAEYRDSLAVEGTERFDLGTVACLESRIVAEPIVSVEYHAFIGAARYLFDLHVSAVTEGDAPGFGQAQLAELVDSLRFAFLRRATWTEYPTDVLAWMDTIARRMPDWLERTRADLEAEPKNWALSFAMAEALRFQRAPAVHTLEPYQRTLDVLAREQDASAPVKLVTIVAEEGLGLGLSEDARTKESIAHFRRGYDLAKEIRHEVRASLAYNLACSYAELVDEPNTLTWLGEAIAVSPRYREIARQDPDFAALSKSEAFRKLIGEPKTEVPAQR